MATVRRIPALPRPGRRPHPGPPPDVPVPEREPAWFPRPTLRAKQSWVDIGWVLFVVANLAAMRLLPEMQTVPFMAIWISLTAIYGMRWWQLQPTILTLVSVTAATGGIITVQVIEGQQDGEYLAEVPLLALMFVVMVWHGRRRQAAMDERLTAIGQVARVTEENLLLLRQQHQFLQDASHELGTPITVALGHAELMENAVTDPAVAADAKVIAEELRRLRRQSSRMLLLASAGTPGFLRPEPVPAGPVAVDAVERWGHTPRKWRLGPVTDAVIRADLDRLALAVDALTENAIEHTAPGDMIEVGAREDDCQVILTVTDSGCGIEPGDLDRIFHRYARAGAPRSREAGGFGLGLAIVQAIAEAHGGSVRARSTPGKGSAFEIILPAAPGGTGQHAQQEPARVPAG
jgi:signal transduction histidine kinase